MRKINTRFFLLLASVFLLAAGALVGLHRLQASNITGALLWQANQAEKNQKFDSAARHLGRYLDFVPDDLEVRSHLASLLSEPAMTASARGRSRARFAIEQVLAKDPQRQDLRLRLVRLHLANRQAEQAKEHLDELQRVNASSAELAYLRGQWLEMQSKSAEACTSYEHALTLPEARCEVYLRLASLYKQMDFGVPADKREHTDKLARVLALGLEKFPTDAGVLSFAAQTAQERGDHQAAMKYLETGLAQHPDEPRLYQALARIHTARSQRPEAIATLRKGLACVRKNGQFELTWTLANLLLDDNQLAEVRTISRELREGHATSADYLDARAQMQQGRWFEAAKTFEKIRPQLLSTKELAVQLDLYLGACYEQLEEPGLQLAAFRRALEADPTSLPARRGAASAFWSLGQTNQALVEYRQLIDGNSNREEAARWRIEYARMLLQAARGAGDSRIAAELDLAEKQLPRSIECMLLRAEQQYAQGNLSQAEQTLKLAMQQQPDRPEPLLSLASLAYQQGESDAALAMLAEAEASFGKNVVFRCGQVALWLQIRPKDLAERLDALDQVRAHLSSAPQAQLLQSLAEAQVELGRHDRAQALLRALAKLPSHAEDLRLRLSMLELAVTQNDEAEMERLAGELRRLEGSASVCASYAEALRQIWRARRGDTSSLERARQLLTTAGAHRPNWHPIFLARAEIDELQGKTDLAIANYRQAIDLGNRTPLAVKQLVFLLTQSHRYEEAEIELRKMQKQFGSSDALQRLSVAVSFNRKDFIRAEQMLKQAIASPTATFRDHLWLGHVLAARGRSADEAEKAFRRAVQLDGQQPEAWVALVRQLLSVNQFEKAVVEIEKARQSLPEKGRALALAQCYEMLGDVEKARAEFKRALQDLPDSALAHRAAGDFYLRIHAAAEAEPLYRALAERTLNVNDEEATRGRRCLALALASIGDSQRTSEALKLVGLALDSKGDLADAKPATAPDEHLAQARVLAALPNHRLRARAIAWFEELMPQQVLSLEDQFHLALLIHQQSNEPTNWKRTRDLLKAITVQAPHSPRYLATYARLLLQHRENAEVEGVLSRLEQIERLRKLPAGSLGSLELRSAALEQRGQSEQAVALLKAFAEQPEAPPQRWLLLASLHARLSQFQEAIDACDKARAAGRPDEALAHMVHLMRGFKPTQELRMPAWNEQAKRVEARLRDCIAGDDSNHAAHLQLADLMEMQGRFDEVESICRGVLVQQPRNLVALNNLAWLLAQRAGKGEEGLELIQRALELYGNRPELLDTRAMVYLNLAKTNLAVRDLERVVNEAPTPARLFHLALAHRQAQNAQLAMASLQRANDLGLSPQHLHPTELDAYQRVLAELRKER